MQLTLFILSLLFRWIAIPWMQSELDKWVNIRNNTASRANTKKVLPHGIPAMIRQKPEQYNAVNFKVKAQLFNVCKGLTYFHRFLSQPISLTAWKMNTHLGITQYFNWLHLFLTNTLPRIILVLALRQLPLKLSGLYISRYYSAFRRVIHKLMSLLT